MRTQIYTLTCPIFAANTVSQIQEKQLCEPCRADKSQSGLSKWIKDTEAK